MRRLSISLRIAAWYAGISLVGLSVFGVVMWFVLATSLLSWKDRTLHMREAKITNLLEREASTPGLTINAKLSEQIGLLPEGELIHLTAGTGERLFPLDRLAGVPQLPEIACPTPLLRDSALGGERFRSLCRPVTYMGQTAYLNIATSLVEDQALLRIFNLSLVRAIPLLLLVSGCGGYILSRRALRPVDQVIEEAQRITAIDLGRRLTLSSPDDQLRRLALEWNNLLERIQAAMIRVTQFTADASHELRSPIAFIRATAEYSMTSSTVDDESREAFRMILDETRTTTDMLETLLMLARPDDNDILSGREEVEVRLAIGQALTCIVPLAKAKAHTLLYEAGEAASPVIAVDPVHLRRVLIALLENAVKYTPDKGVITISYMVKDGLHIWIADTGVGIRAEDRERIFDRFFRADKVRSESSNGVGLGLSIAKLMMERYGGRIAVSSQEGAGSIFELIFPERLLCT